MSLEVDVLAVDRPHGGVVFAHKESTQSEGESHRRDVVGIFRGKSGQPRSLLAVKQTDWEVAVVDDPKERQVFPMPAGPEVSR